MEPLYICGQFLSGLLQRNKLIKPEFKKLRFFLFIPQILMLILFPITRN